MARSNRKRVRERPRRHPEETIRGDGLGRSPAGDALERAGEAKGSSGRERLRAADEAESSSGRERLRAAGEAERSSGRERLLAAPEPLAHASSDAELARASVPARARGRSLDNGEPAGSLDGESVLAAAPAQGRGRALGTDRDSGREAGGVIGAGRQRAADGVGVPSRPRARRQPRESLAVRTVAFLQGSWRELERVQWPNRQQVMQATWVVIGFVAVAAAFLGISNLISEKIIHLILNQ